MSDQTAQGLLSPFLRNRRIKMAHSFIEGSVLDLGCSTGYLAPLCQVSGYWGMDIDEDALSIARQKYPGYRFSSELPTDQKFQTIVALAVIEHVKNPEGLLSRLVSLLEEQGRIVLTTPHPSYEWIHDWGSTVGLFSHEAHDEHETLLDKDMMLKLAERCQLKLITYKPFLFGANQLFILAPASSN